MAENTYGLVAEFATPQSVYKAAEKVRDSGYKRWDVHTPFPVHGMDQAMGLKRSKVPMFTLIGGVLGFCTGNFIAWYTGSFDYPLIVGAKPYFSFIFPFPVAYECTILFAAFGTLGGMFLTNRLPMHYHPVMNYENFARVTDDTFIIVIETADPRFDSVKTREFLEKIGGTNISEIDK